MINQTIIHYLHIYNKMIMIIIFFLLVLLYSGSDALVVCIIAIIIICNLSTILDNPMLQFYNN